MSDNQQRCHDLTPLPKKHLSYSLLSKDEQQSISVTFRALAPVASRECSHVTSCESTLAHVAGDARVDRVKQSSTISSGVSALTSVAFGEQDHAYSGVYVIARVAGDAGGHTNMWSLAKHQGSRVRLLESKAMCCPRSHVWLELPSRLWLEL